MIDLHFVFFVYVLFFCENIKSYIMNIIHARNIYSFYPILSHSVNRDRVYYYVLLLAIITIEPWQTHENYWLKYDGFSSNIYVGSYTCTHDILFKMKMLSYLEVAYVFNNINVFIYQYL